MSFSSYWSTAIWKIVKPQNIVACVAAVVRMATTPISKLHQTAENRPPVATGKQYEVFSVSPEEITQIQCTDKDGLSVTRYKVAGLPAGAVTFSASPDGATALRYVDFYEDVDGYVFSKNPTSFGRSTTRGGDHCTFCMCFGAPCDTKLQDISNHYKGAKHDISMSSIHDTQVARLAVNGASGSALALACGCTPSPVDGAVTDTWVEGKDRYALVAGHLLLASGSAEKQSYPQVVKGSALVDIVAPFLVIPDKDSWVWIDSTELLKNLPESSKKAIPALSSADTLEDAIAICRSEGYYTYDSTGSPDDGGTQRLLKSILTTPTGLNITQRIELTVPEEYVQKTTAIGLICGGGELGYVGWDGKQSALSFLLESSRRGSTVLMDNLVKTDSEVLGITLGGRVLSTPITAGQKIQSVILISDEQNSRSGTILTELPIHNIVVHSGESVAIKLTAGR